MSSPAARNGCSGGFRKAPSPPWLRRGAIAALAAPFLLAAAAGCDRGGSWDMSFVEVFGTTGIDFQHTDGSSGKYFIVETLASGVGLFDYDGDGDLDVYLLNGGRLPPAEGKRGASNALLRNEGGGTFTDVTREVGVPGVAFSIGCCVGDTDGDGDLDLYVTGFGSNVLYRNEGAAAGFRFTDATREAAVDDRRFSAGCAFVDIDGDDDLDLYVSNYCAVDFDTAEPCTHNGVPGYCPPGQYTPVTDSLFLNLGDGTFRDISEESGVAEKARWGMGVLTLDYNGDGRTDIYVANDVSDNFLFENLGGGRFRNVALEAGVALSSHGDEQGSMGLAAGDIDRSGELDLVVTNYQKQLNALYVRDGGAFSDVAMGRGLGSDCLPLVSWGAGFHDFDHDGWLDLFIANGHLEDRIAEYDQSSTYLQRNQLFKNHEGRFRAISLEAGPGLAEEKSSRGAAFGDIDGDGDVDIVVSNSRDRPSLLLNEGKHDGGWVMLELRGQKNVFAIGARVVLEAGGVRHVREVRSGGSYTSQSDLRLHFGLGRAGKVDRVEVRWPGGGSSVREDLEIGRLHVVREE